MILNVDSRGQILRPLWAPFSATTGETVTVSRQDVWAEIAATLEDSEVLSSVEELVDLALIGSDLVSKSRSVDPIAYDARIFGLRESLPPPFTWEIVTRMKNGGMPRELLLQRLMAAHRALDKREIDDAALEAFLARNPSILGHRPATGVKPSFDQATRSRLVRAFEEHALMEVIEEHRGRKVVLKSDPSLILALFN